MEDTTEGQFAAGHNAVHDNAMEQMTMVLGGNRLVIEVDAMNAGTHIFAPFKRSVSVVANSPLL